MFVLLLLIEIAQREGRRRRLGCGAIRFDLGGGPGAFDGGVGVGVEDGGEAGVATVVDDLERPRRRYARVVAQGHGRADQERVDLVQTAVERYGAVFHDPAFGLEQKQIVEIDGGVDVAHLAAGEAPLIEGRFAVGQAAMRGVVVFTLDVGPQTPIEGLEGGGVGGLQGGQELTAYGAEPALDFSFSGRLIRAGMDQGDTQFGAH